MAEASDTSSEINHQRYPILKDFEPDIDAFYNEWLKRPIPQVK
ncbi:acetone carboxylase subunit gamma [Aeribacillus sp. FSL K6-1121]